MTVAISRPPPPAHTVDPVTQPPPTDEAHARPVETSCARGPPRHTKTLRQPGTLWGAQPPAHGDPRPGGWPGGSPGSAPFSCPSPSPRQAGHTRARRVFKFPAQRRAPIGPLTNWPSLPGGASDFQAGNGQSRTVPHLRGTVRRRLFRLGLQWKKATLSSTTTPFFLQRPSPPRTPTQVPQLLRRQAHPPGRAARVLNPASRVVELAHGAHPTQARTAGGLGSAGRCHFPISATEGTLQLSLGAPGDRSLCLDAQPLFARGSRPGWSPERGFSSRGARIEPRECWPRGRGADARVRVRWRCVVSARRRAGSGVLTGSRTSWKEDFLLNPMAVGMLRERASGPPLRVLRPRGTVSGAGGPALSDSPGQRSG